MVLGVELVTFFVVPKEIQRSSGEKRVCQRAYSSEEVTTRAWVSACGAATTGSNQITARPGPRGLADPRTHLPSADQSQHILIEVLEEVSTCSSPPPAG